jgi:hypothetical protein
VSFDKILINLISFLKGAALSDATQILLTPSEPKTKKRAYKARKTCYILSTENHRQTKIAKTAPAVKKSKLKANVDDLDSSKECKFCGITPEADEDDTKKRTSVWVACSICDSVMHVSCVPRNFKQKQAPYLASRVKMGIKFDFQCCSSGDL